MKYKLTKRAWVNIGQSAGWLQEEMEDVIGDAADEYHEELSKPTYIPPSSIMNDYELSDILLAIKALGEANIAGFSRVREDEVEEVLRTCEPYEMAEIRNWPKKTRPKKTVI